MEDFKEIADFVLKHEGGFVNDPDDPGGVTNFGFTAKYLMEMGKWQYDRTGSGYIDAQDMKYFTRDDAVKELYWIWNTDNYHLLKDPEIAKRVFDFAINAGQVTAVKLLQRTYNFYVNAEALKLDGIIGNMTAAAINALDNKQQIIFLGRLRSAKANYYDHLVHEKPGMEKFHRGWLKRAYA